MNAFEVVREQVDSVEVAGRFTEIRRSGGGHVGRCPLPDHEDHNPSFRVYPDGRFHCFGCGRHGDVVDLWAAVRGIEPGIRAALDLAREFAIELPDADPNARRLAEERRRKEAAYLEEARASHDALTHRRDVVGWWEGRGFGESLRRRFLLGAAKSAAIIPYWNGGRVQGLIKRNLHGEPKYELPKAADLVSGHRPLFVPGPVRDGMFLVEGYVDALALAALGFPAAAVGGTGISARQMDELLRLVPGSLYVLPDDDEAGHEAGRRWVEELYPKALLCQPNYFRKEANNDDED